MNKTKIPWAQMTWNPITGCEHGCTYCYARGIAHRFAGTKAFPEGFKPTFHEDRLTEPAKLKKAAHIFAVSMGDMFGEWVPDAWTDKVLHAMDDAPQHVYTVLTKNPEALERWDLEGKARVFYGTSVTGDMSDLEEWNRLSAIDDFAPAGCRLVSVEPLLTRLDMAKFNRCFTERVDWLIVGGQTGARKFTPPREWMEEIVEWARLMGVPCFVKESAAYEGSPQEYPAGVPHDAKGDSNE